MRPRLLVALVAGLLALVLLGNSRRADAAKCPNLVILLDKSGSMIETPSGTGTGPTKWDLAKTALKELLKTYDGKLPIGIALFASDNSCGAAKLNISPAYGTATQIGMLIDASSPDSGTPTSESVTAISGEAVLHDASRQQYILMLTDGIPACASGEPDASVTAIAAAHMRSPAITTFVLGFGALGSSASTAMDRMAVAGGAPATGTTQKYYTANDLVTLKASLDKIFSVILAGGACDEGDSCYVTGCPKLTDQCILGMCRPNPCAGVSCPANKYCYTDGVSTGTCLADCPTPCAVGKRCRGGACVTDPCGSFCGLEVCDTASHTCIPDTRCTGVVCKGTSRCLAGVCTEDPCTLISCPSGTRCVAWEGSCEYDDGVVVPDMAAPGRVDMASTDLAGWTPPDFSGIPVPDFSEEPVPPPISGCSSAPGAASAASLFAMFFMAGAFLLLRTRKHA